MSVDYDKMLTALKEFPNTPEGKAYFEKERKKNEIKKGRYLRFEKWVETHDFDALMQRLEKEHGVAWHNNCYNKGYEPYCNNKLRFIIDYIVHNRESISVPQIESEHFGNQSWFFKGYYFIVDYIHCFLLFVFALHSTIIDSRQISGNRC